VTERTLVDVRRAAAHGEPSTPLGAQPSECGHGVQEEWIEAVAGEEGRRVHGRWIAPLKEQHCCHQARVTIPGEGVSRRDHGGKVAVVD
jgi:hypothetical protein